MNKCVLSSLVGDCKTSTGRNIVGIFELLKFNGEGGSFFSDFLLWHGGGGYSYGKAYFMSDAHLTARRSTPTKSCRLDPIPTSLTNQCLNDLV